MDPVPVPAIAGDLLTFTVDTGGVQALGFTQVVPTATEPSVVRTEPAAGIVDAPIDARIRVVFSEPMIAEAVINVVGIMQDGNLVDGTVNVSPDGLVATIIPTDYLLPGTTYEISIGNDVEDADGSGMQETVTAPFTTAGLPFTGTVAFAGYGCSIMLIDADGTNLRDFTFPTEPECDDQPALSPAGDQVAFTRMDADGWQAIYVKDVDATSAVRLSPPNVSDDQPTWSPDAQRIAFTNTDPTSGQSNIYIMNVDGSNRVPVIALHKSAYRPSWSPDGKRIAFSSYGSTAGPDIFVVDPEGTNLKTLWDDLDDDWGPTWSPDGTRIAFERNEYVFLVNQDGTGLEQLSSHAGFYPTWSPDGKYVVFQWHAILWVASVADKRLVPLAYGTNPSWGP